MIDLDRFVETPFAAYFFASVFGKSPVIGLFLILNSNKIPRNPLRVDEKEAFAGFRAVLGASFALF